MDFGIDFFSTGVCRGGYLYPGLVICFKVVVFVCPGVSWLGELGLARLSRDWLGKFLPSVKFSRFCFLFSPGLMVNFFQLGVCRDGSLVLWVVIVGVAPCVLLFRGVIPSGVSMVRLRFWLGGGGGGGVVRRAGLHFVSKRSGSSVGMALGVWGFGCLFSMCVLRFLGGGLGVECLSGGLSRVRSPGFLSQGVSLLSAVYVLGVSVRGCCSFCPGVGVSAIGSSVVCEVGFVNFSVVCTSFFFFWVCLCSVSVGRFVSSGWFLW